MRKILANDEVIVIAGKDKGKKGKVLRVLPKQDRVIVEGIQLVKKHVKPNPRANQEGGIIEKEASIHLSNIAILNPKTNKAEKVAIKVTQDANGKNRRIRMYKSTNEAIDLFQKS